MRSGSLWRWIVAAVAGVHGVVHFLGTAAGLGLADVPELDADLGIADGVLWSVAGLALVATAVAVVRAPRRWWWLGIPAVVVSQVAVLTAAGDAWVGTVPNAIVLVAALLGVARDGPWSLRTRYDRLVRRHVPGDHVGDEQGDVLTEDDLIALPAPVRRYVRSSGAVGRPHVRRLAARWRGSIRATPQDPWMGFTAEQHNDIAAPARFFLMDARRGGLPVDVLHVYRHGTASMEGRLLSLRRVTHADGPQMDRAETVTVLNDMCILAPGSLVDPRIRWEAVDDHTAACSFTIGTTTVGATLRFDEHDDLVDFESDDRGMLEGDGLTSRRWSTQLWGHEQRGWRRTWQFREARWHPAAGDPYVYFEGELLDLRLNAEPWMSQQHDTPVPDRRATTTPM